MILCATWHGERRAMRCFPKAMCPHGFCEPRRQNIGLFMSQSTHKFPKLQGNLWWARQGLNLRPHPCEGDWRPRVSGLKLGDKIKSPKLPCTSFVREPLKYALPAYAKAFRGHRLAQIARRVVPKHGPGEGAPPDYQKTAGRAATPRSSMFDSCAAMAESYRSQDSVASTIAGGGAP